MPAWLKNTIYTVVVVLAFIQFVPVSRTNPSIDSTRTLHAALPVEASVAATLARGCNDCHSSQTVWPWYSRVAPVSWLVASDVNEGRKEFNFSDWKALSPQKQREILPQICKQAAAREMPPQQYVLVHPRAKLTRAEIDSVCGWASSVLLVPLQQAKEN